MNDRKQLKALAMKKIAQLMDSLSDESKGNIVRQSMRLLTYIWRTSSSFGNSILLISKGSIPMI